MSVPSNFDFYSLKHQIIAFGWGHSLGKIDYWMKHTFVVRLRQYTGINVIRKVGFYKALFVEVKVAKNKGLA